MNGLDLFSGIGGIAYALSDWIRPVAYCEIDPYCQSVLLQKMRFGDLPAAPIWDDVQTLSTSDLPPIEIITAGFPCQDISIAGSGKGLEGERSGLFSQVLRLASDTRSPFIFLENVPAISFRGGTYVIGQLAAMGYDCRWCTISAASIGAAHKRSRWFALCYSRTFAGEQADSKAETIGCERHSRGRSTGLYRPFTSRADWQESLSKICRGTDGVPYGVDRLRALGNAVIPQQVRMAFENLLRKS